MRNRRRAGDKFRLLLGLRSLRRRRSHHLLLLLGLGSLRRRRSQLLLLLLRLLLLGQRSLRRRRSHRLLLLLNLLLLLARKLSSACAAIMRRKGRRAGAIRAVALAWDAVKRSWNVWKIFVQGVHRDAEVFLDACNRGAELPAQSCRGSKYVCQQYEKRLRVHMHVLAKNTRTHTKNKHVHTYTHTHTKSKDTRSRMQNTSKQYT